MAAGANPFAAVAGDGEAVKQAQKNATNKQYDMKVVVTINETANPGKKYFDGGIDYSGVPYAFVVAVEQILVETQQKLVELGKAIATGTPLT